MNYWQQIMLLCAVDLASMFTTGGWIFSHVVEENVVNTGSRRNMRLRYPPGYRQLATTFPFIQRIWGDIPAENDENFDDIDVEPNIGQGNGYSGLNDLFAAGEIPTQTDWWQAIDGPGQPLEGPREE